VKYDVQIVREAIGIESHPESLGVDMGTKLIAGGAAGCTAATATYPLDLVRTRLAAQVCFATQNDINCCLCMPGRV
jgi:hypothetical protein